MLIQFSMKNFMSFKEKVILSLKSSATDDEHPENININGNYSASNSIAIYGANASGKSGLFKAIFVNQKVSHGKTHFYNSEYISFKNLNINRVENEIRVCYNSYI